MIAAASARASTSTEERGPTRVLVVDDAIVARGLVSRWLSTESDIEVVGALRNGRDALDQIETLDPDIALLDVEMPVLEDCRHCRCCSKRSAT